MLLTTLSKWYKLYSRDSHQNNPNTIPTLTIKMPCRFISGNCAHGRLRKVGKASSSTRLSRPTLLLRIGVPLGILTVKMRSRHSIAERSFRHCIPSSATACLTQIWRRIRSHRIAPRFWLSTLPNYIMCISRAYTQHHFLNVGLLSMEQLPRIQASGV